MTTTETLDCNNHVPLNVEFKKKHGITNSCSLAYDFCNNNISVSHGSPHYPCGNNIERKWREIGIQAKLQKLNKETWSKYIMLTIYHVNNFHVAPSVTSLQVK